MSDPPCLVVGVDWGSKLHQVCVLEPGGERLAERSFSHSGAGLSDLVNWLEKLSDGSLERVHVGIEMPHGAVVETLLERGVPVFSINPKQIDRFRDRFSLAGAKDDRRDAWVIARSLLSDSDCFRPLELKDPLLVELREWSRIDEELKQEKVRHGNRLRQQLHRYFPQFLELANDVAEGWILELWKLIPTPQKARAASAKKVARLLKTYRIRRFNASEVLKTLRQQPIRVAAGTVEAASAHVGLIIKRLEVVNEQLRQCQSRLEELLDDLARPSEDDDSHQKEQRDVEILRSVPGLGTINTATLLAEAGQALDERNYHTLRALAGAAPVTKRSGKSWRVVMRRACHPRLRYACYHWARVATQHDKPSRALYRRLRERGKSHGRALRGVADRLLGVTCSMLRHQTLYDPLRGSTKSSSDDAVVQAEPGAESGGR